MVVRDGTFPFGGESIFNVLHPDEGVEQDDGTIHCNDGWGHLMIVVEAEPKQIWTLLPYGESQHPSSPHYGDQARMHSNQQPKKFWFYPKRHSCSYGIGLGRSRSGSSELSELP